MFSERCPLQYCQKLWKFLRHITKEVRARKFKIASCPLNTRTVETLKSAAAWAAATASPNSVLYFDPAHRLWALDFFPQIWNAKNNLNLYILQLIRFIEDFTMVWRSRNFKNENSGAPSPVNSIALIMPGSGEYRKPYLRSGTAAKILYCMVWRGCSHWL